MLGPGAFNARGEGVGRLALMAFIGPAEALGFHAAAFRLRADLVHGAAAVRLADRMAAAGQRRRFFIIHGHALERLAHHGGRLERIGIAVHALGIDVDQAHMGGRQRVLERGGVLKIAIALFGFRQPLRFRAPVDIGLGAPDILTAKAEAEGLQTHILIGHGARQDDEIGPAELVAVLLLHGPEQATRLVEAGIVRPGIERGEADIARSRAAAAVREAIGARRVPGEPDHQAAIMAPVRRPPVLAVMQQGFDVRLHRLEVERLHF